MHRIPPRRDTARPPDRSGPSRRRLLSSVAAAGAVALAGCTGTLPPLGQRVRFGRIDVPDPGPPAYREWVPAASALPDSVADAPIHVGRPADLPPSSLGYGLLVGRADWFGVAPDAFDRVVDVGGAAAFVGPVDPDTVADALADTGYEPAGTDEGHDRYARDDARRVVAAGDGVVVMGRGEAADEAVEAVVDAGADRADSRHEADDAFAAITDAAGETGFVAVDGLELGLEATADAAIAAMSHAYRDDAMYVRAQYLFADAGDVPERRIRRELRASETAVEADAADVRTDGRLATVELRLDYADELDAPGPPLVTWGASHDPGSGVVTLRHEAGESVDADRLDVSVRGEDGESGLLDEPDGRQFADAYDAVEPGDALEVPVAPGDHTVRIVFRPGDRSASVVFAYEIP